MKDYYAVTQRSERMLLNSKSSISLYTYELVFIETGYNTRSFSVSGREDLHVDGSRHLACRESATRILRVNLGTPCLG